MPDQAAEAIGRVADSVERLATSSHQLHEDVSTMHRQQRAQSVALVILLIVVALLVFGSIVDYRERQDAKDAREDIAQVVDDIDAATSPEAQRAGQERVAAAVRTINQTNIALAQCVHEQAPNLEQCVAARVTQP